MLFKGILLPAVALLVIKIGLPCKGESAEPVDLKYYCIQRISLDNVIAHETPVLLVHGLLSNLKSWTGNYEVLVNSTHRNICMVDLRNHGDSPWTNSTDTATMAGDIAHFLDRKHFEKINIIGFSLGGKVSVDYTLRNPDRVNSMIIGDMRPNGITNEAYQLVLFGLTLLHEAIGSVPDGLNKTQAQQYMIDYISKRLEELGYPGQLSSGVASALDICFLDGKWKFRYNLDSLYVATQNVSAFLTPVSGLYEGPSLFVYGTESPFRVWEDEDEILQLFPKAEFFPLQGASHGIAGYYDVFNNKVLEFLSEVD